jgi:hypothetical protein
MNRRSHYCLIGFLLIAGCFAVACGANQGLLQGGKDAQKPPSSATPKTEFDQDMDAMRTAGFAFVYVLRRKDGGKMDAEDRGVIKLKTVDTNRRVATDHDRAFIVGSNYQLPPQNLAALYQRFAVETYAAPPVETANANANSNK